MADAEDMFADADDEVLPTIIPTHAPTPAPKTEPEPETADSAVDNEDFPVLTPTPAVEPAWPRPAPTSTPVSKVVPGPALRSRAKVEAAAVALQEKHAREARLAEEAAQAAARGDTGDLDAFISDKPKSDVLVVDSVAFLRNAPLERLARRVVTLQGVLDELRDEKIRARMQLLPYEIEIREPTPAAIRAVLDFAKLTGDVASLSAVDLRVCALTYMLEVEANGKDHIRTKPAPKGPKPKETHAPGEFNSPCRYGDACRRKAVCWFQHPGPASAADASSGAVESVPNSTTDDVASETASAATETTPAATETTAAATETTAAATESTPAATETTPDAAAATPAGATDTTDASIAPGSAAEPEAQTETAAAKPSNGAFGGSVGSADERGWITPSNIRDVTSALKFQQPDAAPVAVKVGCITADFSMQNVLLQMGLKVITVDGLLVKRVRSYVLYCTTCFEHTPVVTRDFCAACGKPTLVKASTVVGRNGKQIINVPHLRRSQVRGTRYALPMPKGGRHNNIILREDQSEYLRARPKDKSIDVFSDAYLKMASPFGTGHKSAGPRTDVVVGAGKKNPNEKKKTRKGHRNK